MKLKVGELKAQLAGLGDDEEVSILMNSGCCGETETMEILTVSGYCLEGLYIYCNPLPGYRSCIQAGGTIRQDKEYWSKNDKSNKDS